MSLTSHKNNEAQDNQTFNLSPLTNLVITKITSVSPQTAYQYQNEYHELFTSSAIKQAEFEIKELIAPLYTDSNIDITNLFFINGTENEKLNQVLAQLEFEFSADQALLHDKASGTELSLPYYGQWQRLQFS